MTGGDVDHLYSIDIIPIQLNQLNQPNKLHPPYMKLHCQSFFFDQICPSMACIKKRTAEYRISNIECRRVESLRSVVFIIDRSTQKLTTGRIHSFVIRHSTFFIRHSAFVILFFTPPETFPLPWNTADRQVDMPNQTRAKWVFLPDLLFAGFHHPAFGHRLQ